MKLLNFNFKIYFVNIKMNKEYIYKIIDNKINELNTDIIIKIINYDFNDNLKNLYNALKLNNSITTIFLYKYKLNFNFNQEKTIQNLIEEISKVINYNHNISKLIIKGSNKNAAMSYGFTLKNLNPIFETLQFNTSIKELDISYCWIDTFFNDECDISIDDYMLENDNINQIIENAPFYKMLLTNKTLTTLNINNCLIEMRHFGSPIFHIFSKKNEFKLFNKILQQTNIKSLNIKDCVISKNILIDLIENNKRLETLTFSIWTTEYNKKDEDLKEFYSLMKNQSKIKELNIFYYINSYFYHNKELITIRNN